MNRNVLLIGIALIATIAAWGLLSQRSEPFESGASDPSRQSAPPEPKTASGLDGPDAKPRDASAGARAPGAAAATLSDEPLSVDQARAEHEAAKAALREAELELDDLEREVEAVEAFVEDLIERGEDPANHAFEGMERLNPVIERYEERLALAEAADRRVQETKARLEAAQRALQSQPHD